MTLTKQAISLRVDRDVLDWFKRQGKGYQSLMNAVLRSYSEEIEFEIQPNGSIEPYYFIKVRSPQTERSTLSR
jgi:BrnA antitoxin of type II toxin-antitoxin system